MKQSIKGIFCFVWLVLAGLSASAQIRISLATDLSLLRHFSSRQQFWAIGQTLQGQFHVTPKHTAYAWIMYYNAGKFSNDFTATAKQQATTPQQQTYKVDASIRVRELSVGWKPYILGTFNNETGWNVYGLAGLGAMFIRLENKSNNLPDTVKYSLAAAPLTGAGNSNRLTLDLGVGFERSLNGGGLFLYGELRSPVLISSHQSPYRHSEANFPKAVIGSFGLRILIGG